PGARPFSPSALQRYAACPYQFFLGALLRLQPAEHPEPLQQLDPLTRGSLTHAVQATLFRGLRARHALPVVDDTLETALAELDRVGQDVTEEYRDRLAPAIPRVWDDEVAAILRDLRTWLHRLAAEGGEWVPAHFELSFGLRPDPEHDAASVKDPVLVDGRFALRGSVDLVEAHASRPELRVVDHKTGKNRVSGPLLVGGGAVLQPVIYALAVEQVLGKPVVEGRLSFCTSAGGFSVEAVPMTDTARRAGLEVLDIIDRAIAEGAFPAAPRERECDWCDFRPVCGPHAVLRAARKPSPSPDLVELRSRP
ncbi:MAG: PD-(D/E)XK nuclease family protein, partial [Acidimicrobiia bacterium]|nr:PD-(D/E)XK nuclease family protein [Acidimicrobiia bacterium]